MTREIWKQIIIDAKQSTWEATDSIIDRLDSLYTVSKKEKLTHDERKYKFAEKLKPYVEIYGRQMLVDFTKYWCEMSDSGRKMRFEREKVFDVKLRLERWYQKNKQNGKPKNNGHSISESTDLAQRILRGELS